MATVTEQSIHDVIYAVLDEALPDAPRPTIHGFARTLQQAIIARLCAEGLALPASASLVGLRASTVRGWGERDPEWLTRLDASIEAPRKRLEKILWRKADSDTPGTPGVGQAINVLAHSLMPELRERKVEATVTAKPDPEASRRNLETLLERGE